MSIKTYPITDYEIGILPKRREIIISFREGIRLEELERYKENLDYIFEKRLLDIAEGEIHCHLNNAGKIDQWKMILGGKREKRKSGLDRFV